MIKFLTILVLLALGYLGVNIVNHYDTNISIMFFDYKIDIKLFSLIVVLIMVVSIALLGLRVIGMIVTMPYNIAERLSGYKKRNRNKMLMECYANIVIGDMESAQRIISKFDEKEEEYTEHIHLLKAICNQDFDKNMYLLQNLLSNKEYHDFAAKTLAIKLFNQGYYAQSLKYAEHVRMINNKDHELMYLLAKLYSNLDMWEKFSTLIERYAGDFTKEAHLVTNDISKYYLKAAKYYLGIGDEKNSIGYLTKSLEYNPMNLESIETLCNINLTLGRGNLNLAILEDAFSLEPSFTIFELYLESSSMSAKEVYEKLGNLVDMIAHRGIFLAIAASCGLIDEIDKLRKNTAIIL